AVLRKVAEIEGLNQAGEHIDYQPWQDFQRWLEAGERRVIVPFSTAMADLIPPASVRLRRDVGQVIRAIKAHALLHRQHRERDDAGQIVADIEHDYAAVRTLMNDLLAESSGVSIKPAMVETIKAVTLATIQMKSDEGATAQAVSKILKLDKSAARRRLLAAVNEGFVRNLETHKGQPGRYLNWIGQDVACKYGLCEPPGFDDTLALPSFDCKAAKLQSEFAICANKRLARHEASLSKQYVETIRAMPPN